jgi:hypothetical protein
MFLTTSSATPLAFRFSEGKEFVVRWGMDTAWNSSENVRRGTNHIGKEYISTGRISFQPSDLVDADGNLSAAQKQALASRIRNIKLSGTTEVMLNCDHEVLNKDNYVGKPEEWYRVIKASVLYAQSQGLTVTTIAPFNEPDYSSWGQGSKGDFREIARLLSEDPALAGIRISAGNTLNCDQADSWYQYMKPYVSEGNTHQLAGSFDTYARFFQTVRADGNHATADELHNVGEAIVGVEYGLQSGVWWGYDGLARGQFCRANSPGGARLGYAEDRSSWTSACVYRLPDSTVKAFFGTSERQANTHSYELQSLERDVFVDGRGPLRTYAVEMPGGTGYQTGQTNAELMLNIQYGADVPPFELTSGTYVVLNRNSMRALQPATSTPANGTSIVQSTYTQKPFQTWTIEHVDARIGGDFSYYTFRNGSVNGQLLDVLNYSVVSNSTIITYAGTVGANEQWSFEYAGNGDYYIRSRHSGLYLDVRNGSTVNGAAIIQAEFTGKPLQRWHIMPADASPEFTAPAAPTGLKATPQTASVRLTWNAGAEEDLDSYIVLRGTENADTIAWEVIGRNIKGTEFVDNACSSETAYRYAVRAVDRSINLSALSESITAQTSGEQGLVAQYQFDQNLIDNSPNQMDAAAATTPFYMATAQSGSHSWMINGNNHAILPHAVANLRRMTLSTWTNITATTTTWQRIFDFGNNTSQYMFLTPNSGSDMRFVIKNGGEEQMLTTDKLTSGWHHVAVTIDDAAVSLYIDGELKATTSSITLRPADFRPALNYIGRSQYSADPLLRGRIDDFRIYNYALTADDVKAVMSDVVNAISAPQADGESTSPVVSTDYFSIDGQRMAAPRAGITIVRQRHADGRVTTRKLLQ